MALLGPVRLGYDEIETLLPRVSPGVFVLGNLDFQNRFSLNTIGRDDVDLKAGLRSMIGSAGYFMYSVQPTGKAAFDEECRLFHELRPSRISHPVRSENKDWTCPHCRVTRDVARIDR